MSDEASPLLRAKAYDQSSVFQPENPLREGRRQRGRPDIAVPSVCLLDPDGDIVRHLTSTGEAAEHPGWACYHTTLWTFDLDGIEVGALEVLDHGQRGQLPVVHLAHKRRDFCPAESRGGAVAAPRKAGTRGPRLLLSE